MRYTLFLIFLLQVLIVPQEIYRNEAFSVTGHSVTESGFRATALSDSSIASNYFPAFQEDFNLSFNSFVTSQFVFGDSKPSIDAIKLLYINE